MDERLKVLEMVAEGRITAEQGDQLLDALGDEPPVNERPYREARAPRVVGPTRRGSQSSGFHQLKQAKLHGVDAEYVHEMRDAGFPDLAMDNLIQGRIHGVDRRTIEELRALGLDDMSFRDVVNAKIHDIHPDFVEELRAAGFTNLSFQDIIDAKIHGLDARYIQSMRELDMASDEDER